VKHIVALSGGKDSTAMALRLTEVEPQEYIYVCTPTGRELPEMKAHWAGLSERLQAPIISPDGPTLTSLIQIQKALPNWRMRWCTRMMKIKPFEEFIRQNTPCTVYIGIRADESGDREGVDYDVIPGVTRRFPMDEWGWQLSDVLSYLKCKGQSIPVRTDCDTCFFQTLYEWYLLWRDHPNEWAAGEAEEAWTGYTYRSPQRDSWPASMQGLRLRFEAGDVPKDRTKQRTSMCSVCAR
jgi:hypothetical protein